MENNTKLTFALTKRFTFEAAHHITGHKGKCKTPHGHSYVLDVTVIGGVHDDGFVIDFGDLKQIVQPLIGQIDHHDLNTLFLFSTTAENLVQHFYGELFKLIKNYATQNKRELRLTSIRLWEQYPKSSVCISGELND